jgi:hypothetical protein
MTNFVTQCDFLIALRLARDSFSQARDGVHAILITRVASRWCDSIFATTPTIDADVVRADRRVGARRTTPSERAARDSASDANYLGNLGLSALSSGSIGGRTAGSRGARVTPAQRSRRSRVRAARRTPRADRDPIRTSSPRLCARDGGDRPTA